MSKVIIDSALKAAVNVRGSILPSELIKSTSALFSAYSGKQNLPDLPYDYNALEPAISSETMTIHHSKHHNTYVTNLNAAMEKLDAALSKVDVNEIIALQSALKFNGGGHLNHSLFWENLSPTPTTPSGEFASCLDDCFGSLEKFKSDFTAKTVGVQGSGWGWLGYNPSNGRMEVATCSNQDPLQPTTGLVPLVGVDVWEHAYYVDYRNVRPDYVKAVVEKLINWDVAAQRWQAAAKK